MDSGEESSVEESTESEVPPKCRSVSIQASISPEQTNACTQVKAKKVLKVSAHYRHVTST